VVATMTFWNKVSPVFFYLDDVRSGADDDQVRVSSARFEGSLQIFAVGVSVSRCSWLSFVVAITTSSFDLFGDKIWFLQPSVLVVKDCKPVLLGVFPQADVFSAVARSRCKQRVFFAVFKALYDDGVCRCPFRMKKTTREFFGVILFFYVILCQVVLPLYYQLFCLI
jgi:hypothetical protein